MAIALRGTVQFGDTGAGLSTACTVNKPSGTTVGDVILIYCGTGNPSISWTVAGTSGHPASFTAVSSVTIAGITGQFLWRIADGTEDSTFTVTCSLSRIFAVACVSLSGVNTTQPFDNNNAAFTVSGQANASSSTVSCSAVTDFYANDFLVWFAFSIISGGAVPALVAQPAGYTLQTGTLGSGSTGTQDNTTASGNNVGIVVATNTQSATGTTGAANGSLTISGVASSKVNAAMLVTLHPILNLTQPAKATPSSVGAIIRSTGKKTSALSTSTGVFSKLRVKLVSAIVSSSSSILRLLSKKAFVGAGIVSYFPFFFPSIASGSSTTSSAIKLISKTSTAMPTSTSRMTRKAGKVVLSTVSSVISMTRSVVKVPITASVTSTITAATFKLKLVLAIAQSITSSKITNSIGKLGQALSSTISRALTSSAKIQTLIIPILVSSSVPNVLKSVSKSFLVSTVSIGNALKIAKLNSILASVSSAGKASLKSMVTRSSVVNSSGSVGTIIKHLFSLIANVMSNSTFSVLTSYFLQLTASVASAGYLAMSTAKSVLSAVISSSSSAVALAKNVLAGSISSEISNVSVIPQQILALCSSSAGIARLIIKSAFVTVASSTRIARLIGKKISATVNSIVTVPLQSSVMPDVVVFARNRIYTVLARIRGN